MTEAGPKRVAAAIVWTRRFALVAYDVNGLKATASATNSHQCRQRQLPAYSHATKTSL